MDTKKYESLPKIYHKKINWKQKEQGLHISEQSSL